MGYNSDMFLSLRDEEVNSSVYFQGKSKKEVVQSAEQFADELIQSGEFNSVEALTRIVKLKAFIDTVEGKVREDIASDMVSKESLVSSGVKIEFSEGSMRLNYKDDLVYESLQNQLKQREELLKVAFKSENPIYDHEGVEVPKVSPNYTKPFLKVSY
jgi:hypothetical protein